jgi:hypothetical protein
VSKPTGWVRARLHRLLLACAVVVPFGIPVDGSDAAAQARAATPAPTAVRDVQKRLAELKFLAPLPGPG